MNIQLHMAYISIHSNIFIKVLREEMRGWSKERGGRGWRRCGRERGGRRGGEKEKGMKERKSDGER